MYALYDGSLEAAAVQQMRHRGPVPERVDRPAVLWRHAQVVLDPQVAWNIQLEWLYSYTPEVSLSDKEYQFVVVIS